MTNKNETAIKTSLLEIVILDAFNPTSFFNVYEIEIGEQSLTPKTMYTKMVSIRARIAREIRW